MANTDDMEIENAKDKAKEEHPNIRFRNYTPFDNTLKHLRIKKATVPPVVEEIDQKLKEAEVNADKVNILALAPKKPNFDLKRDVEKKLKKLDIKTNKAIYELLKKKLEQDQSTDLAAAVDAGSKQMGY